MGLIDRIHGGGGDDREADRWMSEAVNPVHDGTTAQRGPRAMETLKNLLDNGARPISHNIYSDDDGNLSVQIDPQHIGPDGSFVMFFRLADGNTASLKINQVMNFATMEPDRRTQPPSSTFAE